MYANARCPGTVSHSCLRRFVTTGDVTLALWRKKLETNTLRFHGVTFDMFDNGCCLKCESVFKKFAVLVRACTSAHKLKKNSAKNLQVNAWIPFAVPFPFCVRCVQFRRIYQCTSHFNLHTESNLDVSIVRGSGSNCFPPPPWVAPNACSKCDQAFSWSVQTTRSTQTLSRGPS